MNDPHQSRQRPTSGLTALPSGHGPPAPRPSRRAALFPIRGCGAVALAQWPWSARTPNGIWVPAFVEPLGMVQKVDLVGGWVTGTRIDTEVRTVFVRRVARFKPGMAVNVARPLFWKPVSGRWGLTAATEGACEPVRDLPLTALASDVFSLF
jgi:hypothetical protein